MGEFVFGVMRDVMRLGQIQTGVDIHLGVGMQAMPDPAHPHTAYVGDIVGVRRENLLDGPAQPVPMLMTMRMVVTMRMRVGCTAICMHT